jgi:hypothetical protein
MQHALKGSFDPENAHEKKMGGAATNAKIKNALSTNIEVASASWTSMTSNAISATTFLVVQMSTAMERVKGQTTILLANHSHTVQAESTTFQARTAPRKERVHRAWTAPSFESTTSTDTLHVLRLLLHARPPSIKQCPPHQRAIECVPLRNNATLTNTNQSPSLLMVSESAHMYPIVFQANSSKFRRPSLQMLFVVIVIFQKFQCLSQIR